MRYVHITPDFVEVCGKRLAVEGRGLEMLTDLYRRHVGDWPKFFKMDPLCKLGFVASELLLEGEEDRFVPRDDRAVLLFSRNGSFCDDAHFNETADPSNFFPSPALFVYTLPNTVTGEIAIRNKYMGETAAFVLDDCDPDQMRAVVDASFEDRRTASALTGWLDLRSESSFEAVLFIAEKSCTLHRLPMGVQKNTNFDIWKNLPKLSKCR